MADPPTSLFYHVLIVNVTHLNKCLQHQTKSLIEASGCFVDVLQIRAKMKCLISSHFHSFTPQNMARSITNTTRPARVGEFLAPLGEDRTCERTARPGHPRQQSKRHQSKPASVFSIRLTVSCGVLTLKSMPSSARAGRTGTFKHGSVVWSG